jgi:hypothetical protein
VEGDDGQTDQRFLLSCVSNTREGQTLFERYCTSLSGFLSFGDYPLPINATWSVMHRTQHHGRSAWGEPGLGYLQASTSQAETETILMAGVLNVIL